MIRVRNGLFQFSLNPPNRIRARFRTIGQVWRGKAVTGPGRLNRDISGTLLNTDAMPCSFTAFDKVRIEAGLFSEAATRTRPLGIDRAGGPAPARRRHCQG